MKHYLFWLNHSVLARINRRLFWRPSLPLRLRVPASFLFYSIFYNLLLLFYIFIFYLFYLFLFPILSFPISRKPTHPVFSLKNFFFFFYHVLFIPQVGLFLFRQFCLSCLVYDQYDNMEFIIFLPLSMDGTFSYYTKNRWL